MIQILIAYLHSEQANLNLISSLFWRSSPWDSRHYFRIRHWFDICSWRYNYHFFQLWLKNLATNVHYIWKFIYLNVLRATSSFNLAFVVCLPPLPHVVQPWFFGYRGVGDKIGLNLIFNIVHNGFFPELLHFSLSYRNSFHYSVNSPVTLGFHYIIYISWYNSTV